MGLGTTFFFELSLFAPTSIEGDLSLPEDGKNPVLLQGANMSEPQASFKRAREYVSSDSGKALQLLVVDDSLMNRKMTRRMLESGGTYHTQCFRTPFLMDFFGCFPFRWIAIELHNSRGR